MRNILHISAVALHFAWANGFFCFVLIGLSSIQGMASEESYEIDVQQAAKAGDAESQYALALLYEYGGDSVGRDPQQAIIWFEKAGEAGVAGACLTLGLKYEYGNRVQRNLSKAACWYACAAHKDWPAAQYFLAIMYEKGKGVQQSTLLALAWFGLAAEYGYPEADVEFSKLRSMTEYTDIEALRKIQGQLLKEEESPCN